MRLELALFNVRVLTIVPGYFPTSFIGTVANTQPAEQKPTAYFDPSQGYGSIQGLAPYCIANKYVGDTAKLAERLYEIVTRTGIGEKYEWHRVVLGTDCGEVVAKKLGDIVDGVRATESLWRSTDMDSSQLQAYAASVGVTLQ